jgi:hypothetical protein
MHALPESGHFTALVNVFFIAIPKNLYKKPTPSRHTDFTVPCCCDMFSYDEVYIPSDGTIMSRKKPMPGGVFRTRKCHKFLRTSLMPTLGPGEKSAPNAVRSNQVFLFQGRSVGRNAGPAFLRIFLAVAAVALRC